MPAWYQASSTTSSLYLMLAGTRHMLSSALGKAAQLQSSTPMLPAYYTATGDSIRFAASLRQRRITGCLLIEFYLLAGRKLSTGRFLTWVPFSAHLKIPTAKNARSSRGA